MAFVYWIRKKEHNDIFTQGYVGITSKAVEDRYKRHWANANCMNPIDNILYKAMLKYGPDNLVVSTIVKCSYEYASFLENKLRPKRYIGWNIAIGGADPTVVGMKHSEDTKKKMRSAKLGTKLTEDHKIKISKTSQSKSPWDRPGACMDKWRYADLYYLYWVSCKSHQVVSRKMKLPNGFFSGLFSNFDRGYNPFSDVAWCRKFLNGRGFTSEQIVQRLREAELFVPVSAITNYLDSYIEGTS